jgi:hypothetical protein
LARWRWDSTRRLTTGNRKTASNKHRARDRRLLADLLKLKGLVRVAARDGER